MNQKEIPSHKNLQRKSCMERKDKFYGLFFPYDFYDREYVCKSSPVRDDWLFLFDVLISNENRFDDGTKKSNSVGVVLRSTLSSFCKLNVYSSKT